MKKVILVAGNLAALKSTISKALSQDLDAIVLNKDTLKEVLGDTIGFANREENLKLSRATFQLMKKLTQDILSIDDVIILESNFKPIELAELFFYFKSQDYHVLTLMLSGDPEVLYQRYVERDQERHPVHRSTGLMNYDIFLRSMMMYDPLIYGESSIYIDTTTFNETDYQTCLNQVKAWIFSIPPTKALKEQD
jgi:predicted kinase